MSHKKGQKKKRKRRSTAEWRKLLGNDYLEQLDTVVDELFERACRRHWTWAEFARQAKLNYQTVKNLGERRTKLVSLYVVISLANALDCHIQVTKGVRQKVTLKVTWGPRQLDGRYVTVA